MSRLEQLHKLLEIDPSDADVPYMIAHEHAKADEHESALEWFDRCLAQNAHYCYAYFHKARSEEALGRLDDARQTLRLGIECARVVGDAKAAAELSGFLDELE